MMQKNSRPVAVYLIMFLMLFQGFSGIGGGIGLILDPTGESMQIPLNWLNGSPFQNYLIPGIVLFVVLGLLPLLILYKLWRKWPYAWYASLLIGIALIIWITVEITIIGYQTQPPLQAVYGTAGLLLLILLFLPSVKNYYAEKPQDFDN
ncbi:hypothetical protein GF407_14985 [candidate division KSB1 bacterium]|nr:hypothetical protein [candidate division KSB1 bacterium]